jgi:hypothetical protein
MLSRITITASRCSSMKEFVAHRLVRDLLGQGGTVPVATIPAEETRTRLSVRRNHIPEPLRVGWEGGRRGCSPSGIACLSQEKHALTHAPAIVTTARTGRDEHLGSSPSPPRQTPSSAGLGREAARDSHPVQYITQRSRMAKMGVSSRRSLGNAASVKTSPQ